LVDLPAAQAEMISAQLDTLARLGFDLEPFGGHMVRVRALPDLVGSLSPADALHALVEELDEDESPLAKESEGRLAARVCKRAAVKAGQVLSILEQEDLVSRLERCRTPQTCPHGRPTMICFSADQLERQFGRRG
jgi:DNA mismatch repair protein MutL